MTISQRVTTTLLFLGILGCHETTAPAAPAVQFKVDAPLCVATAIPFVFSIDQSVVGSEVLENGQTSKVYATSPGQHVIGAVIWNALLPRDTTVTLRAGETFTDVLPVYCS